MPASLPSKEDPLLRTHTPVIVMLFIMIGVLGLSFEVGTLLIFSRSSMPSMHFPNTGCLDEPGENQSKFALLATLMKNCEPPPY